MKKTRTRDEARENELVAASKAMSPQARLEAAARLSAIAFQFHRAGITYREGLGAAKSVEGESQGEGVDET
ncbi:MAG: hypothetical protein EHM61_04825 [Acidobacteria bacterium]|nr:MAG: hypothetical protein EHM61_04825 [Acidobacteriota bacterium]